MKDLRGAEYIGIEISKQSTYSRNSQSKFACTKDEKKLVISYHKLFKHYQELLEKISARTNDELKNN